MGSPSVTSLTFLFYVCTVLHQLSESASTIKQLQFLRDGETIVSPGNEFQLRFFSPERSNLRYLGIWYNKFSVETVVWVANRNNPVLGKNGSFTIGNDGNLMVLDHTGTLLWSSSVSVVSKNSTATLTDTGNLILTSGTDPSKVLWQSFEHPTDSYLPGMSLHTNASNGENHMLWSWKSAGDPSIGNYSTGIDTRGTPQLVTWEGSKRLWRSGHWNGVVFLGVPSMRSFLLSGFQFAKSEDGGWDVDYTAFSDTMRFYISWDGYMLRQSWSSWNLTQLHPGIECEQYNRCGVFGMCTGVTSAICGCLEGFHPHNHEQWDKGHHSGGCIRTTSLNCNDDRFLAIEKVKLPDFTDVVATETTDECKQTCLKNCSCYAYAFVPGIQCMMWNVDLVDVQQYENTGETLYIRLSRADIASKNKTPKGAIIGGVAAAALVLAAISGSLWRFRSRIRDTFDTSHNGFPKSESGHNNLPPWNPYNGSLSKVCSGQQEEKEDNGPDLPKFSFSVIAASTNNFSIENKLGQGGFGPVYKGTLPGGQEIAVKRLSRLSGQGLKEFKNEIALIAKLQHRNLVRLLGCSIEGEEKLLLYEYMPNKSLDFLLFEPEKEGKLDWRTRYSIIEGIIRGLVYLHRDSRLRIIHRDLKASNILLDEEMIPKISDFGMAKMFGGNENEANTLRVVGTYGYMSPEYAMEGIFSVKSDVYSFGVLLLEIISGRKNTSFRTSESLTLIRYSWSLWHEGKAMELVDHSIADSCDRDEVLRCIHVALLCVQDSTACRPTMSSVILMMDGETSTLPEPKRPTYSKLSSSTDPLDLDSEGDDKVSRNNVTITSLVGR